MSIRVKSSALIPAGAWEEERGGGGTTLAIYIRRAHSGGESVLNGVEVMTGLYSEVAR